MWITGQVYDDPGRALPDVTIEASGRSVAGRRAAVTAYVATVNAASGQRSG
jgi:hypothetical protein